jgi:two-component system LytT family response regulator
MRGIFGVLARRPGSVRVLDPQQVSWISAERDYVRFHEGGRSLLVRRTMASVQREFEPLRFARIHRSTIVNLDHVVELRPVRGGDCRVVLREGTVLTLSRVFRRRLTARDAPYNKASCDSRATLGVSSVLTSS